MHHVEHNGSSITLLTEKEISNPFLVLKDTFKELSSAREIHDELFEILTLSIRRNYWMTYKSPLVIYKKYKKLMRLFEAGWLIHKIRPDFTIAELICVPYDQIGLNNGEHKGDQLNNNPLINAYQIMNDLYNSYSLNSFRCNLFHMLFEGLMPSCVSYDHEFESYTVTAFQQMTDVISSLHLINQHEKDFELSQRDIEVLNTECEEFMEMDTLYDYDSNINDMHWHSKKDDIIQAIRISKTILNSKGFWKSHSNPANILYYYHDFLFIIDHYWEHYQLLLDQEIDFNTKWEYPKTEKGQLFKTNYEWIKRPWKFLHDQFEKKSISEWRIQLELCLEDVLSNNKITYRINRQNDDVLNFVEGLLFWKELTKYEPNIF